MELGKKVWRKITRNYSRKLARKVASNQEMKYTSKVEWNQERMYATKVARNQAKNIHETQKGIGKKVCQKGNEEPGKCALKKSSN